VWIPARTSIPILRTAEVIAVAHRIAPGGPVEGGDEAVADPVVLAEQLAPAGVLELARPLGRADDAVNTTVRSARSGSGARRVPVTNSSTSPAIASVSPSDSSWSWPSSSTKGASGMSSASRRAGS
jgi:hypothetical protein